jgi:hypothetical protein
LLSIPIVIGSPPIRAAVRAGPSLTWPALLTLCSMLGSMRDESGRPNVKTRLVALLTAIGLLVVAAPAVIPLVRWIADLIW